MIPEICKYNFMLWSNKLGWRSIKWWKKPRPIKLKDDSLYRWKHFWYDSFLMWDCHAFDWEWTWILLLSMYLLLLGDIPFQRIDPWNFLYNPLLADRVVPSVGICPFGGSTHELLYMFIIFFNTECGFPFAKGDLVF